MANIFDSLVAPEPVTPSKTNIFDSLVGVGAGQAAEQAADPVLAAPEPEPSPAEAARRLGMPGFERHYGRLTGETFPAPSAAEIAALEEPLLRIPESVKTAIGHSILTALNPIFGLSQRASREVGESAGSLIESATSPVGIATVPAAAIAPGVVLPPLIKSGFEAGVQQIAEGRPIAGATTIALAASPVLGLRGARGEAGEPVRAIRPSEPPAQPPPLPSSPPPLPVEGTAPLPRALEAEPAAQQSLWRRLLEKNFEIATPKEVFDAAAPVEQSVLDTLADSIKSAKPARAETEVLRRAERAQRASRLEEIQAGLSGKAAVGELKQALAGELPRVDLEPLSGKLTAAQEDSLFNHIASHKALEGDAFRKSNLAVALENLIDNGHLPQPNQIAWFEKIFGPKVASAMLGKQRGSSLTVLREMANLTKSTASGFDLSAAGRQGLTLGIAHPQVASRAFEAQVRAFFDRDYAQALDRSFRVGDRARVRDEAGLSLPSIEGLADSLREELFSSRIIQSLQHVEGKTPVARAFLTPAQAYAKGLAGSERAFTTHLNFLRSNVFDSVDDMLVKAGLEGEQLAYQRQQLARLINAATGRGNIRSSELLNFFLFSPKFAASRFEYPLRAAKLALTNPTAVGMEARRQLAAQTMAWTTLLTMLHLGSEAFGWDAKFGWDPRKGDFGKVTVGNKTIDVTAGYGPAMRIMARFLTGKVVTATDKERKANRDIEVGRFLHQKLAPLPGEVWSVLEGKDLSGKKIESWGEVPAHAVENLLVPITAQQAHELWEDAGAAGLPYLVPEVLGFGVNVQNQLSKRQ